MTIDGSRIQIALTEGERWRRTMSITVPADVVREHREEAARKLASRLKLPGFRKGKIPAGVVERRYGAALNQETLDKVIGAAYREALSRKELRPISEGEIGAVDYEPEKDLTFEVSFDVQPEIQISRLGGFAVERPGAEVADADVDRIIERLREQQGAWRPVPDGTPGAGESVQVEIVQLGDEDAPGETRSYEFILGQGDAIPDVESAISSLEVGATGDFAVRFPDDFPNEERRGVEQRLRITLKGRKVKDLPDVDDDFARSVGDFDGLADLRGKVRADLEREARGQAEDVVRGRLLDFVIDANRFEVPGSMVDGYVDAVIGDASEIPAERLREARASIRPQAEMAVKRIIAIDRIAETQGLRATEEEIDARVEEIAARNDLDPAKVYAELQRSKRLESLEREITETKVFDFLKEKSTITETAE